MQHSDKCHDVHPLSHLLYSFPIDAFNCSLNKTGTTQIEQKTAHHNGQLGQTVQSFRIIESNIMPDHFQTRCVSLHRHTIWEYVCSCYTQDNFSTVCVFMHFWDLTIWWTPYECECACSLIWISCVFELQINPDKRFFVINCIQH